MLDVIEEEELKQKYKTSWISVRTKYYPYVGERGISSCEFACLYIYGVVNKETAPFAVSQPSKDNIGFLPGVEGLFFFYSYSNVCYLETLAWKFGGTVITIRVDRSKMIGEGWGIYYGRDMFNDERYVYVEPEFIIAEYTAKDVVDIESPTLSKRIIDIADIKAHAGTERAIEYAQTLSMCDFNRYTDCPLCSELGKELAKDVPARLIESEEEAEKVLLEMLKARHATAPLHPTPHRR